MVGEPELSMEKVTYHIEFPGKPEWDRKNAQFSLT